MSFTFFQTRKTEEFHKAEVISCNHDFSSVVGICSIDVIGVRVFGPDAVDLWPENSCKRCPVYGSQLLLVCTLFTIWRNQQNHTLNLVLLN